MAGTYTGRLKRKDVGEVAMDYICGDDLAPSKKMRVDPGFPSIFDNGPDFVMACDDLPVEISPQPQPTEPFVMVPEPPPVVPNEEKALVLYKPVNPPIFPGGPAAGSADLPIKFNANCLPNYQATWQMNSMVNMPDLFRFVRAPDSAWNSENLKRSESNPVDNRLAVVPWVPSQFPSATQESSSNEKLSCDNGIECIDSMPVEDEDAISMEEDPMQPPPSSTIACTGVTNETGIEGVQWQHCMTPQPPQNTQVMWSY
eukprot:Gb_18529 [translate_table: standard]